MLDNAQWTFSVEVVGRLAEQEVRAGQLLGVYSVRMKDWLGISAVETTRLSFYGQPSKLCVAKSVRWSPRRSGFVRQWMWSLLTRWAALAPRRFAESSRSVPGSSCATPCVAGPMRSREHGQPGGRFHRECVLGDGIPLEDDCHVA